jgi:tRNA threonylcarbamoyl adenosine modification protein YeaZ
MTLNPNSIEHAYGLGLDTTTAALTLGIGSHNAPYRYQTWHLERAISSQLHPLLQAFMAPQRWTDLAWIAVLKGPGSFTGTRIGVVTARTLAQQLNLPLFGFSNLAIAAWLAAQALSASLSQPQLTIAVSQLGQQGTIYGAMYQIQLAEKSMSAVVPDQLFPEPEWSQLVSSTPGLDQILGVDQALDPPLLAEAILTLGWQRWDSGKRPQWEDVLPYYG